MSSSMLTRSEAPSPRVTHIMTSPNPDIMVRVARKWVEAENIAGFELVPAGEGPLPSFSAGSHIDVHLPEGIVRQYSLVNAPGDVTCYEIGVLRDPASRGGSITLHDRIGVGDIIPVSAPRNHFPLVEDGAGVLLIARGIGITPILSMAERLDRIGTPFALHYVTRTAARLAYRGRLRERFPASCVHLYDDESERPFDLPAIIGERRDGGHIYVCGSPAFIDSCRQRAEASGWRSDHVHFEYFANEVVHGPDDGSFDVVLKSTGQIVRVGAEEAITDALERTGVHVAVSCMQGVCGTCVTRVIEGEIDHRDLYFTAQEQEANDCITPCCSRAAGGRLVLDL